MSDTPDSTTPLGPAVPLLDVGRQNEPLLPELESALAEVCRSGAFVFGPQVAQLETAIAEYCGADHAVGCASGSDALLLALMALDIGPGDEVVLPSFTFFATAGAVWRLGAKCIFADIDPATFNLDPADVAAKMTPATKAILPVHLFGACADMTALGQIAAEHDVPIVEDAAQAIGAEHHGRRAGSMGAVGCFSFYPTKNLGGCGDGGIITTGSSDLAERLRMLRNHGQEPRYYHAVVGINSRLDTLQAAALLVKLARLEDWNAQRTANAERYTAMFTAAGLAGAIALPTAAEHDRSVWNQYTIRAPFGQRDALQQHLGEARIGSAIYYPAPLHLQECFRSLGYQAGNLPQTEAAAGEVLSLPIFAELTEAEQAAVVARTASFFGPKSAVVAPLALPLATGAPATLSAT